MLRIEETEALTKTTLLRMLRMNGTRHERGEAKIDHLVKDGLRLLLIFRH
jgi:hypothetical protein